MASLSSELAVDNVAFVLVRPWSSASKPSSDEISSDDTWELAGVGEVPRINDSWGIVCTEEVRRVDIS